jgi:hypothetical protein
LQVQQFKVEDQAPWRFGWKQQDIKNSFVHMPSMGQTINYPFIKCTHNMVAEKNCMNNTHKLLAETQQSNDLLPDTDILIQGQDLFHHQMVESNSFQTHQNNRRLF